MHLSRDNGVIECSLCKWHMDIVKKIGTFTTIRLVFGTTRRPSFGRTLCQQKTTTSIAWKLCNLQVAQLNGVLLEPQSPALWPEKSFTRGNKALDSDSTARWEPYRGALHVWVTPKETACSGRKLHDAIVCHKLLWFAEGSEHEKSGGAQSKCFPLTWATAAIVGVSNISLHRGDIVQNVQYSNSKWARSACILLISCACVRRSFCHPILAQKTRKLPAIACAFLVLWDLTMSPSRKLEQVYFAGAQTNVFFVAHKLHGGHKPACQNTLFRNGSHERMPPVHLSVMNLSLTANSKSNADKIRFFFLPFVCGNIFYNLSYWGRSHSYLLTACACWTFAKCNRCSRAYVIAWSIYCEYVNRTKSAGKIYIYS